MKKLKIAVIGVGGISVSHINAYLGNPDVELYAFCDINEKRLKEKGAKYGITRLYTDEDEMLKALPELDAVSVCVWNWPACFRNTRELPSWLPMTGTRPTSSVIRCCS